jgi:hypothetical protein
MACHSGVAKTSWNLEGERCQRISITDGTDGHPSGKISPLDLGLNPFNPLSESVDSSRYQQGCLLTLMPKSF